MDRNKVLILETYEEFLKLVENSYQRKFVKIVLFILYSHNPDLFLSVRLTNSLLISHLVSFTNFRVTLNYH